VSRTKTGNWVYAPSARRWLGGLTGLFLGLGWDRAKMEAFQTRRLRAVVRHACESVPYYRGLFERADLQPSHIQSLADLTRIPLTSRSALQSAPARAVIARGLDPRELTLHLTSGSRGQPLTVRRTWFEDRLLQAYRLRVLFRLGLRARDRRIAVVFLSGKTPARRVRTGLLRYEEIDCFAPPQVLLAQLRKLQPDVLRGYPANLSWLTGFFTDADRKQIRPKLIVTDSETITTDMRERIRDGFGARVVDFYDSHEFNMIAWECVPGGSYHVSDASIIVEVVRDGRAAQPGEEGELVATALHSFAMPFIRYRLGDLVTRGPSRCACGAASSTLAAIQGRTFDRFELPGGRSIHPYRLATRLVSSAPWLRQFQIVQEEIDRIRLRLVVMAGSVPPGDWSDELRRVFGASLGEGIHLEMEIVDRIAAEPSGKFRPYYSLVRERHSESKPRAF
jgi:phenylacetate-CoA ligase